MGAPKHVQAGSDAQLQADAAVAAAELQADASIAAAKIQADTTERAAVIQADVTRDAAVVQAAATNHASDIAAIGAGLALAAAIVAYLGATAQTRFEKKKQRYSKGLQEVSCHNLVAGFWTVGGMDNFCKW